MKKLWKNNRVVFVLVIILIICFISIIGVTLTFFYSKDTSTYGNRLDNIEKYPVSNEIKASYKDKMLENENVIFTTNGEYCTKIAQINEKKNSDNNN